MKRSYLYLMAFAGVISFASCAPVYVVRERPREVVYVRPTPPTREHIWISGDWIWASGRYEWREGHWDRPKQGRAWRDGHWQNTNRGYRWVPGHWDRY